MNSFLQNLLCWSESFEVTGITVLFLLIGQAPSMVSCMWHVLSMCLLNKYMSEMLIKVYTDTILHQCSDLARKSFTSVVLLHSIVHWVLVHATHLPILPDSFMRCSQLILFLSFWVFIPFCDYIFVNVILWRMFFSLVKLQSSWEQVCYIPRAYQVQCLVESRVSMCVHP